jgi:UDP-2,4-diacetamido-2,4,6-trideoxy-beta-L-altropyranose hydrolase
MGTQSVAVMRRLWCLFAPWSRNVKFAFRVDYTNGIGMGHVRRCLTMANEAQRLGHSSLFVQSAIDSTPRHWLAGQGHAVSSSGFSPASPWNLKLNPDWSNPQLAADEVADATAFVSTVSGNPPDVIVLDHYFMTQRWIDRVRAEVDTQFVVLEDLQRSWEEVEFIVNGNLDAQVVVSPTSRAQSLLGPRYAFLSGEYREIRDKGVPPAEDRRRILVFAGGGDTVELAITYLEMASTTGFGIDVVASSSSVGLSRLTKAVSENPQAQLHIDVPSLAALYSQARLALGAGGTSSWERACLGVPSVVTSVAENQVAICDALDRYGLAKNLGASDAINLAVGNQLVRDLANSPRELSAMSQTGMQMVDGLGALRTLQRITNPPNEGVLRKASYDDAGLLLQWANDPEVIRNSVRQRIIGQMEHIAWLKATLEGSKSELYIYELAGLPVGQIRFDRIDDHLVLTYSVDCDFRGRGLGKLIVKEGLENVRRRWALRVEAMVREENAASAKVFSGLGFKRTACELHGFDRFTTEDGV